MVDELRIAPDLTLPLEAVIQTFAVLAERGVGLLEYKRGALAEERGTGEFRDYRQVRRMHITANGRALYSDLWWRYRELYPDAAMPHLPGLADAHCCWSASQHWHVSSASASSPRWISVSPRAISWRRWTWPRQRNTSAIT